MKENPFKNEIALIKAFHSRDERAFKFIFEQGYKKLCIFSYKIVRDEEEACDIVSESFLKLFSKPEQFSSMGRIMSFMFLCCRNASFDKLAKAKTWEGRMHEYFLLTNDYECIEEQKEEVDMLAIIIKNIEELTADRDWET